MQGCQFVDVKEVDSREGRLAELVEGVDTRWTSNMGGA